MLSDNVRSPLFFRFPCFPSSFVPGALAAPLDFFTVSIRSPVIGKLLWHVKHTVNNFAAHVLSKMVQLLCTDFDEPLFVCSIFISGSGAAITDTNVPRRS